MFGGLGNDTFAGFSNDSTIKYIDGGGGFDRTVIPNFDPSHLVDQTGNVTINGVSYPCTQVYNSGRGFLVYFNNYDGTVVCFAEGTLIMTADGERPVETLRAGDLVLTVSGHGAPLKPVRWVGRREVVLEGHPRARDVAPILVMPGALGQGVPHRSLRVSPDHGLLVEGVLVPAGLLVDDVGILRLPARGRITYHHVELFAHDLLLADGAPTESYLEMSNRHAFANAGVTAMLHPDFAPRPGQRREPPCRPVVTEGLPLEAARAAIAGARRLGTGRISRAVGFP